MFRDLVEDLDDFSTVPEMLLDVPFVPTDKTVVRAMLKLAEVGRKDIVYDLGSGEGCILIAAARDRGARGIGIEIDPLRIADAMEYAADAYVEHQLDFLEEDIFDADISEATVVTLYLLHSVNVQLRPKLLNELRPGTRVISHAFHMGDWQPDEKLELAGVTIFKWIIPAQIAGVWEWEGYDGKAYRVELQQKYQEISGSAWVDGKVADLKSAMLSGNSLDLDIQAATSTAPDTFTLFFENNELQSIEQDA